MGKLAWILAFAGMTMGVGEGKEIAQSVKLCLIEE